MGSSSSIQRYKQVWCRVLGRLRLEPHVTRVGSHQREEPPASRAGEVGGVKRVTSELNSDGRGECVEPEIEGRRSRRARILREEQN